MKHWASHIVRAERFWRASGISRRGYPETLDPAACCESDWKIVKATIPQAAALKWADFAKDADTYFAEIRELVVAMFHGSN